MPQEKPKESVLGLTPAEVKAALKRYEVLCEHHSNEDRCSFYQWEEEALKRVFGLIKDDPDAVALLCNMVQYCLEKDSVASRG